ncbi:FUN14 family-domain-containing protein [Armillaria novae-zelandiae]|uniref:FUN14 family-domain-containing protein n=1 Tax=Armillaria novae-zelandiae TaxID=153914 RepID=A0AA39UI22_9AGAR|nr:FUN14 family-domain-containing protein [Armillaria novae-zelandiae]
MSSMLFRPRLRFAAPPFYRQNCFRTGYPYRFRFSSTAATKSSFSFAPRFFKTAGVAGVGLGTFLATRSSIHCDAPTAMEPSAQPEVFPPPPSSSVSIYELSFGTVAGICSGVFIKKGAKAMAFFLGGIFVLLQYLVSFSVIRVDWVKMGGRFENLFYTTDATGRKKSPTLYSLFKWIVDFLTADFQPRASFVAGLALGLRLG